MLIRDMGIDNDWKGKVIEKCLLKNGDITYMNDKKRLKQIREQTNVEDVRNAIRVMKWEQLRHMWKRNQEMRVKKERIWRQLIQTRRNLFTDPKEGPSLDLSYYLEFYIKISN